MSRFHVITTRQQSLPFDNDKKFVRHQIIIKFNSLFYIVPYRSEIHSDYTPKWRKKHSKFNMFVYAERVHMVGRILYLKMQEEVDNNDDDQVLREIFTAGKLN